MNILLRHVCFLLILYFLDNGKWSSWSQQPIECEMNYPRNRSCQSHYYPCGNEDGGHFGYCIIPYLCSSGDGTLLSVESETSFCGMCV